ncbi:histone deacetylase family protein [Achromobacter denitrificans]|nr:histone deacetylase family protein [Achromobacter denitrificans]
MKAFISPTHDVPWPGNAMIRGLLKQHHDRAERSIEILAALRDDLRLDCRFVQRAAERPVELFEVHAPDYLHYLETAWDEWSKAPDASFEVRPYINTNRYFPTLRTRIPVTLAGQYLGDGGSPLVQDAWVNMNGSVDTAVAAADAIIAGERSAYALLRPAGHHAMRDLAMGGCHIANTAIAAQRLAKRFGRVAVLDIDVHHGNGTQQIFYDRDDVLTVSLHGKPETLFPFICGYADEIGTGAGEGYNCNLPMDGGTAIDGYLGHFDRALQRIKDFAPGALVVAAGYDTFRYDPFGNLDIDTADYAVLGDRIAQLGVPTLFVQEGGYKVDTLRANVNSLVEGYLTRQGA